MRHLLIFLLAYSIFLTSSVLGDLPSCIRAKCSHCKVPFIAQMCPIACSGCPNLTQKFLTTEQQARSSSAEEIHQRTYAHQPHNIKVPFAQQIPNLDSNRNRGNFERNNFQNQKVLQQQNQFQPTRQQHQPQQYINNPPQQQFNEGWQGNGGGGQFGQQFTQQIPNQAYGGNYQFPQQQIQYPPGTFQPQIQQTTNFGGSYGQAGAIGQNQPGPNNLQGPPFNNPFQPFLQQSFQSVQQIQPSQTGFSPPNLSPINQPSFQAPLNQQTPGEIAQIPPQNVVQQSQFFSNQGPNQNNIQFPLQNPNIQPAQQVFIQKPINEAQPFQQNGFRPVGINQPILHAVPNVVDPLQRPRQLLQNIRESQEKYSGEKIIYNKGAATNEIKKPIGITTNFPVDRGQKCPKSNWEPCVSKEIANQRFQNCCSRLGDGCLQLCSYDQNLTTIQLAVLTGRCPVNKVADMMLCASGYEDATICCQAFGVFEPGYEQCRPYCNPAGGLPNDGMLAEKYRCLQKLPQIQRCFYLTQRP